MPIGLSERRRRIQDLSERVLALNPCARHALLAAPETALDPTALAGLAHVVVNPEPAAFARRQTDGLAAVTASRAVWGYVGTQLGFMRPTRVRIPVLW